MAGPRQYVPRIRKSPLLAAAHDAQWRELGARYDARLTTAFYEQDEERRSAMLAVIEQQESAERAALAARQQIEAEADFEEQKELAALQADKPVRPVPEL